MHDTTTDDPALRRTFLARLERCARLARSADVAMPPQWRRLARQAAFSAYRDCVALGLEREARAVLALVDRAAGGVR